MKALKHGEIVLVPQHGTGDQIAVKVFAMVGDEFFAYHNIHNWPYLENLRIEYVSKILPPNASFCSCCGVRTLQS